MSKLRNRQGDRWSDNRRRDEKLGLEKFEREREGSEGTKGESVRKGERKL